MVELVIIDFEFKESYKQWNASSSEQPTVMQGLKLLYRQEHKLLRLCDVLEMKGVFRGDTQC